MCIESDSVVHERVVLAEAIRKFRRGDFLYPTINNNKFISVIITLDVIEFSLLNVIRVRLKLVLMTLDTVVPKRLNEVEYCLRRLWHLHRLQQAKVP